MPRVTIAIPCFNAERWIAACVESALAQTWPDKEVIVVDDGSTDRSREEVRAFGNRVRLLEGGHRGSNAARNTALQAASGEWVQFLDADDFLLPEKVSQQLAGAADEDVIFSPVLFDQNGQRTAQPIDPRRPMHTQWLAWELPQTGGCLWRKSALVRIGGWNEATPFCQEFELYSRAIRTGLNFRFSEQPGAVYRVWSEGTLCRKDPTQLIAVRTQLYQELIGWLREKNMLTEEDLRFAGRIFFEMSRSLAQYDLASAAQYHRERRREGLIHLTGPAAPASYRAAYRVLGFTGAEKLATALRREK